MSDMSCLGDALRRRDEIDPSRFQMPFGKFKGKPLGALESSYLRWTLKQPWGCHDVLWQINQELLRRAAPPSPIDQDS